MKMEYVTMIRCFGQLPNRPITSGPNLLISMNRFNLLEFLLKSLVCNKLLLCNLNILEMYSGILETGQL